MPPSPQPTNQPLTIRQKIEIIKWLAKFPAISILVFWRRDLGYRLLNPTALLGTTCAIALVAFYFQRVPRSEDLIVFAVLSLIFGLEQRAKRWRQMRGGRQCHSFCIGTSPFESWKKLPAFCLKESRLNRFADPLFFMLFGIVLYKFSPILGAYIVFSSLCLRMVEHDVYKRHINRELDTVDSLIVAENQGRLIEEMMAPQNPAAQDSQESESIPTGLGEDIDESVHRQNPHGSIEVEASCPPNSPEPTLQAGCSADTVLAVATQYTLLCWICASMILLWPFLIPASILPFALVALVTAYLLVIKTALKLAHSMSKNRRFWLVLSIIPIVNLLAYNRLAFQAKTMLKMNGIRCGFFGVSRAVMQRYGSPTAKSEKSSWTSPLHDKDSNHLP